MSGKLWDAVSTVIDDAHDAPPGVPLREDELVEAAVTFANRGSFRGFLPLLAGLFDKLTAEQFEPVRARLAADLDAIAAGAATDEIAERSKRAASRMVLVPSYEFTDGALRVQHQYIVEDLDARLAYVTLLFLDSSRPYGKRLCRCKLAGCGVFFWERRAEKGGKPGRSYCSREHMRKAHIARVAERVRKHREKKRRAKRKGNKK